MVLSYCLAVTMEDTSLLASSFLEVGCTLDEAKETTLAVEQCLSEEDNGPNDIAGSEPDDLRRRDVDEPRQLRQPLIQIRGTKWARAESFNVTISATIVGLTLGLSALGSTIAICFCCIRDSSRRKKARAAADAKEALKASGRK